MQDIRRRVAQRQGIDLSIQQIQDLAARRLESILDPRTIKPSLLDAFRRTAGAAPSRNTDKVSREPAFRFEDTTIYDSHRGTLRLIRRLLNPLLKLFFNPNPLIQAVHLQARLNVEAAEREADLDRLQTEWNALHYEILQRLVTEVSRVSLELKPLSMCVESLDAKLDFNERRVRDIEGSVHRSRPQRRAAAPVAASPAAASQTAPTDAAIETASASETPTIDGQPSDGTRRRRRRRRGKRTGVAAGDATQLGEPSSAVDGLSGPSAGPSEPQPPVEPVAQNSDAAPAPAAIPGEPQPPVEPVAQDSNVAPASGTIPEEPQPPVEPVAQNSHAAPAPAAIPEERQPAGEPLALDPSAAPTSPAVPAEPQPTSETLTPDQGTAPAPSAALPDADRTDL